MAHAPSPSDLTRRPLTIVLDTSVVTAAVLGSPDGPSAAVMSAMEAGLVQVVSSPAWFDEIAEVLERPRTRRRSPELARKALALLREARPAHDPVPREWALRDPNDWHLLDLALASRADYIVSWDRDLLDGAPGLGFRALDPPGLMRLLRGG